MNLLAIRTEFVQVSGRYDLVVNSTAWADAGANKYIQRGQRMLDRKVAGGFARGKYLKDLTVGDYKVSLIRCRSIEEVWVADGTSRTRLKEVKPEDLRGINGPFRDEWFTEPFTSMTGGRPLYYYPATLRRVPENGSVLSDSATLTSYLDTVAAYDGSFTGLIMLPPADIAYVIEVVGLFYTPTLSLDADENFWTVNYPNLLVTAALRQLDVMYNGAKNVKALDEVINEELIEIEMDTIAQEITNISVLEG